MYASTAVCGTANFDTITLWIFFAVCCILLFRCRFYFELASLDPTTKELQPVENSANNEVDIAKNYSRWDTEVRTRSLNIRKFYSILSYDSSEILGIIGAHARIKTKPLFVFINESLCCWIAKISLMLRRWWLCC